VGLRPSWPNALSGAQSAGTKLMDEEVDVLLSVAKSDADGQVDFEHFVGRVSELLQKPSSEG